MTGSSGTTQFGYDAAGGLPNLVAEYSPAASTPGSGGLAPALRRYVFGAGGEPLVQYEGSGTSPRWWLHADERGSVVAVSDAGGDAFAINSYDEYGFPGAGNAGRFQYTGQPWMPSIGLYHYRARMYSPALGRFMQTDPIGFAGGMNIYGYVGNDPINLIDPLGLGPEDAPCTDCTGPDPVITGHAPPSARGWARPGSVHGWMPRMVGENPGGGGGPPPPPLPPHCRRAQQRAEATRGDIPSYIANNNSYNDLGALQRASQDYRANAAEFGRLGWVAFGGSTTNTILGLALKAGSGWVSLGLGAVGGLARWEKSLYEAAARGVEARIEQLRLMNEGECPRGN